MPIRTQKTTHIDDPIKLGRRLRAARSEAGLTLRELGFPGCSAAYISHIESGRRTPSLQIVVQLAHRLGMTPEYLAWGSDEGQSAAVWSRARDQKAAAFALNTYGRALARARTPEERLWALAGLVQLASIQGDVDLAGAALSQALEVIGEGSVDPSQATTRAA